MPNRIIREGILHSPVVNVLDAYEEVFYRRLLNVVDDFGRCPAHPAILRALCFPLRLETVREADISRWLEGLKSPGLIVLYHTRGQDFLQVCNFNQRQRTKSKYPDPPKGLAEDAEKRAGFLLTSCAQPAGIQRANGAQAASIPRAQSYSYSEAKPNTNTEATPELAPNGGSGLPPAPLSHQAKGHWAKARIALANILHETSFEKYVKPLELVRWESGGVTVAAPDRYVKQKLEENYREQLLQQIQAQDESIRRVVILDCMPIVPGIRTGSATT